MNGRWLTDPAPRPDASWKLFCFPWSGAGAGVFRAWPDLVGPSIEVRPVVYPGRERRVREALIGSVEELAEGVLPELLDAIDRPYALFGHSLGALVAYSCALELRARGLPPIRVFIAGSAPPGAPPRGPAVHTLNDVDFLRAVADLQDGPDEVLSNPEFAALILPALRADIRAAERYVEEPKPPLHCPITTFAGNSDPAATPKDMLGWQSLAHGELASVELDGDHLFVAGPGAQTITKVIVGTLSRRNSTHGGLS